MTDPRAASIPTIQETIDRFLKPRKPHTARTYKVGLDHFKTHLEAYGLTGDSPVAQVRPEMVTDFISWLRDHLQRRDDQQPISKSSLHTYLAAVVAWYGYVAIEADWIADVTITRYEKMRRSVYREAKVDPRILRQRLPSAAVINRVLAVVRGAAPALPTDRVVPPAEARRRRLLWLRNRALVEVLLSTGMRVGELVALRRSDLLADTREIEIVTSKGQRSRVVICSTVSWDALQSYLQSRDGARRAPRTPLFSSHHSGGHGELRPLTTRAVENVIREIADRAGIVDFHLTPHSFRHYFATVMLAGTDNLALVQRLLGHENPATTEIYAQVNQEQARQAHRAIFDVASDEERAALSHQGADFAATLASLMAEDGTLGGDDRTAAESSV